VAGPDIGSGQVKALGLGSARFVTGQFQTFDVYGLILRAVAEIFSAQEDERRNIA